MGTGGGCTARLTRLKCSILCLFSCDKKTFFRQERESSSLPAEGQASLSRLLSSEPNLLDSRERPSLLSSLLRPAARHPRISASPGHGPREASTAGTCPPMPAPRSPQRLGLAPHSRFSKHAPRLGTEPVLYRDTDPGRVPLNGCRQSSRRLPPSTTRAALPEPPNSVSTDTGTAVCSHERSRGLLAAPTRSR